MALRLAHPRYGAGKTYEVRVEGEPAETDLDKVRNGIFLEGRRTAPARVQVLGRGRRWALLRVEIHEGRKREIRKLFDAVGFPVADLARVDFAGLTLEGLKTGEWRYLNKKEVDRLRARVAKRPEPGPPQKERGHVPKVHVPSSRRPGGR